MSIILVIGIERFKHDVISKGHDPVNCNLSGTHLLKCHNYKCFPLSKSYSYCMRTLEMKAYQSRDLVIEKTDGCRAR